LKVIDMYCIENWNFSVSGTNPADIASMFTMFRSSDDRVLLTVYTAELKSNAMSAINR